MPDQSPTLRPPPPLVALAGWLAPGAGYWLIGQRSRAITIGVTVVILFLLGILIAGIGVVEAPNLAGGSNPLGQILQKPWFLGQALIGPIGLIAAWISHSVGNPAAHARLGEIGTLYTAVAGMLNLLAIIDSTYRAAVNEKRG